MRADAQNAAQRRTYSQKVAQKQAHLLKAAKAAFAKNGYQGLRMSDVAKRAGVAEGTVYSYYASKDDLIRALVGEYWATLTADAREAIKNDVTTDARLTALAQFHIDSLISRYDMAELTITLGRQAGSAISFTDEVRAFVRIFDDIFTAGQDRGDITQEAELWIARDLFYGSLEYSARTIIMRAEQKNQRDLTRPVVDNLMQVFRLRYGAPAAHAASGLPALPSLIDRLETAVTLLESPKG